MKKGTFVIFTLFICLTSNAQFSKLLDFSGTTDGSSPNSVGPLTLSGNVLYGMARLGGANNLGCIFSINDDGTGYTKLLDFSGAANGSTPSGSLILSGSVLYGMASGGASNRGCIFKINTDGTGYSRLYDFSGTPDGDNPTGSLTLSGSVLYGMTQQGGAASNNGCIFKINTDGSGYSRLLDFSGVANGAWPYSTLALSGSTLYGMTYFGGINNLGVIFKINTDGTGYTKLLDFSGVANGKNPYGSLTISGNVLYGMTATGGANNIGCIFSINTDGTGYAKLLDFSGAPNASQSYGSLVFFGNMLYGMASIGGANNMGCIFKINTDGTGYSNLFDFSGVATGNFPTGELIRSGSCSYGMTFQGGTNNLGVIFKYCDASLPIELISFSAEYNKGEVYTQWVTATETNNNYFTIERSTDGRIWKIAGIVAGAGNSSAIRNYAFVDTPETLNLTPVQTALQQSDLKPATVFYYRLKQTDFDGRCSYSNVAAVKVMDEWNRAINFSIYPNPINIMPGESLSFTLFGLQKVSPILVLLNDLFGREYYSKTILSDVNGNASVVIESNIPLPTGVYLIRASSNNKLYNKKIVFL
ncbi:MAG: hypothetical protein HYU69_05690 [Bacteroidetes bacterium]|nr:hypothetical protein [Bacteroidota bacterium]